jgi:hypothetical protein
MVAKSPFMGQQRGHVKVGQPADRHTPKTPSLGAPARGSARVGHVSVHGKPVSSIESCQMLGLWTLRSVWMLHSRFPVRFLYVFESLLRSTE